MVNSDGGGVMQIDVISTEQTEKESAIGNLLFYQSFSAT
jgi:hypothetical protein